MKPGSVLVDIAVDQGGCFEDTHADHARRPDVPGAQLDLLLRGEHARRGAEHLDLRADQRDPAVRRGAGRQGLASRPAATTTRLALGLNTHAGQLTNAPVGEARGIDAVGLDEVLSLTPAEAVTEPPAARPRASARVRTYLDHLAVERGLAANTLTSYRRDLRALPRASSTAQGIDDLDGVTEATVTGVPGARCARATPTTRR